MVLVALFFIACVSPEPEQPTPAQRAPMARGAKVKGKAKGKVARKGKAPRGKAKAPVVAPIGKKGPISGVLQLSPAVVVPGQPEGTEARLKLTFEGGAEDVLLGKVAGPCKEIQTRPIGPKGKEQMALWMASCTENNTESELAILQVGASILVMKALANLPEGKVPLWRPVRRVAVVPGAKLVRGATTEPAPAPEEKKAPEATKPDPAAPALGPE